MVGSISVVGLGEALWDMLPGGMQLGGAPLNVACHAQQLLQGQGGRAIVASRVGCDPLGDEIVARLQSRGLTADFLQRDERHATSTVRVEIRDGQPQYEFAADIAWDHLDDSAAWTELASGAAAVCFGTLAQRSAISRRTIWQFLDAAPQAIRLFDVNLRPPYYDRESVGEGLRCATIVKLNDQELPLLTEMLGLTAGSPVFQLAQLRARHELEAVVYTRGRRGTMFALADKVLSPPAVSYPVAENSDTVGAGDACTAAVLAGWCLEMAPARIAELANRVGAYVASQPGATPELPKSLVAEFAR